MSDGAVSDPLPHITGYSDPMAVEPGSDISFLVSTTARAYEVYIERLPRTCDADDRVSGAQPALFHQTFEGREQASRMGSCVEVPNMARQLAHRPGLLITMWVFPTLLPSDSEQVLVSTLDPESTIGWEMLIDCDGCLKFRVAGDGGALAVRVSSGLSPRRWQLVHAGYSLPHGLVVAGHGSTAGRRRSVESNRGCIGNVEHMADTLVLAAGHHPSSSTSPTIGRGHFNGRLEAVRLASVESRADRAWFEEAANRGSGDVLAHWDFSLDPGTTIVRDVSGHENDGRLVNMPVRAVKGHAWTGEVLDPRARPHEYGAIHFHDDDVDGLNWTPDFTWTVPSDAPSGVYTAVLRTVTQHDEIPFVILPIPRQRANVVVVLPTLTYQAYANIRVLLDQDPLSYGVSADTVYTSHAMALLARHPEWGRSLYDVHSDGSGCMYASRLRPLLSMRPSYVNSVTAGPRNFSADLLLLRWLDEKGFHYDVITDEDLDRGTHVLGSYRVVLTGSHPEYCTENMLDALQSFVASGASLMYLGGNGFYWVTSFHAERRDCIEVRRGNAGTRPWSSEPGETHHSTTGEPGGLWRDRGRPPNRLVGIHFSTHSWGSKAGHYIRLPASFEARHRWIFEGVPDAGPIGDQGLIMGGAAGDEMDRHDPKFESPGYVARLATSAGLPDQSYPAIEEINELVPNLDALRPNLSRADVVFCEHDGGGAVFAVGSLCWIGSLLSNNCENPVSQITENVLRKFMRKEPSAQA
jgi:N,N-dimethylformamidase